MNRLSKLSYQKLKLHEVKGDRMLLEKQVLPNRLRCLFIDSNEREKAFISLHIGAGYGDRMIAKNSNMQWIGAGTTNILMNIRKNQMKEKRPDLNFRSAVTMDTATIFVEVSITEVEEVIEIMLSSLLREEIEREEFVRQKQVSTNAFLKNLEHIVFRSMMEIQTYALPNRLFNLSLIKQDLEEVQYEDVLDLHQAFFHPNNIVFVACGDMDHIKIKKQLETQRIPYERPKFPAKHVYKRAAELVDQEINQQANTSYFIGSLAFRSESVDFSLEEEQVFLQMIGSVIFKQDFQVEVSKDQASIIYFTSPDTRFKQALLTTIWNKNKFEQAKMKVYEQYRYIKENDASMYSYMFGQFAVKDLDLSKLLQQEEALKFNRFREYIDCVKDKMAETKIHYSNGG